MNQDIWADVSQRKGIPEVSVTWVANNMGAFQLVDVREPDELRGPLGRLEDANNVPLRTLVQESASWDTSKPVVVFCRSGGRSGQAAMALQRAGFLKVASMAGGMLEWHARSLPTL